MNSIRSVAFQDKMASSLIDASSELDAVADLLGLLAVVHKPCGLIGLEHLIDFADDFAHRAGSSRFLGEAEDAKSDILAVGKNLESFDDELAWLDTIICNSR